MTCTCQRPTASQPIMLQPRSLRSRARLPLSTLQWPVPHWYTVQPITSRYVRETVMVLQRAFLLRLLPHQPRPVRLTSQPLTHRSSHPTHHSPPTYSLVLVALFSLPAILRVALDSSCPPQDWQLKVPTTLSALLH